MLRSGTIKFPQKVVFSVVIGFDFSPDWLKLLLTARKFFISLSLFEIFRPCPYTLKSLPPFCVLLGILGYKKDIGG